MTENAETTETLAARLRQEANTVESVCADDRPDCSDLLREAADALDAAEATVARLTEERDCCVCAVGALESWEAKLQDAERRAYAANRVFEASDQENARLYKELKAAEARATAAETREKALCDELHDAELVIETLTGQKIPPREAVSGPSDTPKE